MTLDLNWNNSPDLQPHRGAYQQNILHCGTIDEWNVLSGAALLQRLSSADDEDNSGQMCGENPLQIKAHQAISPVRGLW